MADAGVKEETLLMLKNSLCIFHVSVTCYAKIKLCLMHFNNAKVFFYKGIKHRDVRDVESIKDQHQQHSA